MFPASFSHAINAELTKLLATLPLTLPVDIQLSDIEGELIAHTIFLEAQTCVCCAQVIFSNGVSCSGLLDCRHAISDSARGRQHCDVRKHGMS